MRRLVGCWVAGARPAGPPEFLTFDVSCVAVDILILHSKDNDDDDDNPKPRKTAKNAVAPKKVLSKVDKSVAKLNAEKSKAAGKSKVRYAMILNDT